MRFLLLAVSLGLSACVVVNSPAATPSPPTPHVEDSTQYRGADNGKRQQIAAWYSVNPDCTSMGDMSIKITRAPLHGQIDIEPGQTYPNFDKDNVRFGCNRMKVPGTIVYYTSEQGFAGKDSVTLEAVGPAGKIFHTDYVITVR